jgi:hypothetical protein
LVQQEESSVVVASMERAAVEEGEEEVAVASMEGALERVEEAEE